MRGNGRSEKERGVNMMEISNSYIKFSKYMKI